MQNINPIFKYLEDIYYFCKSIGSVLTHKDIFKCLHNNTNNNNIYIILNYQARYILICKLNIDKDSNDNRDYSSDESDNKDLTGKNLSSN